MKWIKFALSLTLLTTAALSNDNDLTAQLWQATDARDAAHQSFASALTHGSAEQKRIAALGLGRIGGDSVVERLSTLLASDDVVQRYALFGLGISLSEQAGAPLQTLWRQGGVHKANRGVALLALANTGNDDAQAILVAAFNDAVKQNDSEYAAQVAQALGQLWSYRRDKLSAPAKDAVPLLMRVIAQQPQAAMMAAFALSRVRREADFYSIDDVLTQLKKTNDPRTALFLARAYGTPASSKASADLLVLAQQSSQPFVRYEAAFALARGSDEQRAWAATAQLAQHRDVVTAISAIQGLSERPALIEQHRAEVEKWRELLSPQSAALKYSVNRALPSEQAEEETKDPAQKTFEFEQIKSALGARYRIDTERGAITIRLSAETPYTAFNFAQLADQHYFDGRVFFRVVPGFVAQTGDPHDTGNGGPGYSIREELSLNPQDEHWLGMATAGKDTAGSQFFFNVGHNPHLDWHYTTFAKIEKGIDVIAKIMPGDKMTTIKRLK